MVCSVGMVDLSPEQWNLPLTAVIPGLAEFYQGLSGDKAEIYISQWDKITPWALAAQIAGVARQGVPGLDLLYQYLLAQTIGDNTIPDPTTQGLPPLNGSELGPCAQSTQIFCTPNEFVGSVQDQAPTFLPWTSPAYANNGFMLLGIALLNITGKKDFDALYNDAVISPLEMTSTNISTPPQSLWSRSAIVGADPRAYFAIDGGYTKSSGGIFSTINDLAKFGVGILNHTLLCKRESSTSDSSQKNH